MTDIAFALHHITQTFEEAERAHPDLMEPYSTRLADAQSNEEKLSIMRCWLRETIRRRYPLPAEVPQSESAAQ
jgi:hypothetical protein